MPKLKTAIILDKQECAQHMFEFISWLNDQTEIENYILVLGEKKDKPTKINYECPRSLNALFLKFIISIEKKFLSGSEAKYLNYYDQVNLNEQGLKFNTENDITLDLVITINFNTSDLKYSLMPKLGFINLTFSHNNPMTGFWEVINQIDCSQFRISLMNTDEQSNCLVDGKIATKSTYYLNKSVLIDTGLHHLKRILLDFSKNLSFPLNAHNPQIIPHKSKLPSFFTLLKYSFSLLHLLYLDLKNSFIKTRTFNFGVAYQFENWDKINLAEAIRIENPDNGFLADPFLFSIDDKHFCFVEDYNYEKGLACISAYEINQNNNVRLGEVIVEPFHLSYPFIFEYDSKIYMCPETKDNQDIRLYESTDFPLKWSLSHVLMTNIKAVDCNIFKYKDLWWLLTTIENSTTGENCSELNLFYADSPISDHWTSHINNPIMVDSTQGRNGGILFKDKKVFRVSQHQGFNLYGQSFAINEITKLSTTHYEEHNIKEVRPDFFNDIQGTHHLHGNDDLTVFDYRLKN